MAELVSYYADLYTKFSFTQDELDDYLQHISMSPTHRCAENPIRFPKFTLEELQ